jgi:hypothetical protein
MSNGDGDGDGDGDWELATALRSELWTTPGWTVRPDLTGTPLDGRNFDRFEYQRDEHDWLQMWACGRRSLPAPTQLQRKLFRFREWAQEG